MRNQIDVHFDGGCRPTNPGNKYGSWEVLLDGQQVFKASRVEFGWGTSNESEFNSLIQALQWTVENLHTAGFPPEIYTVTIFTDSMIVRNMGHLTRDCLSRLTLFKLWSVEWRGRKENVERFGH